MKRLKFEQLEVGRFYRWKLTENYYDGRIINIDKYKNIQFQVFSLKRVFWWVYNPWETITELDETKILKLKLGEL